MTQKYLSKEYDPINGPDRRSYKQKFQSFLYNEDTGEILGRTPQSWGKITLFYLCFYTVLGLLFAACLGVFLQQWIDPRIPYRRHELLSAGLDFRPRPPDVRSTLISYRGTQHEDYAYWERQLVDFLSVYKKKGQITGAGQNIYNCNYTSPPPGKVCDVDVTKLKPCIEENHFSFHKSSPCIFLKLNKVYGWVPEPYRDSDVLPEEMPNQLKQVIRTKRAPGPMVWVWCQGASAADAEWLGPLSLLPEPGFPVHYFPYNNAEGYLSPLVALHVRNPRQGILLRVVCRAWARNLPRASTYFELMVD